MPILLRPVCNGTLPCTDGVNLQQATRNDTAGLSVATLSLVTILLESAVRIARVLPVMVPGDTSVDTYVVTDVVMTNRPVIANFPSVQVIELQPAYLPNVTVRTVQIPVMEMGVGLQPARPRATVFPGEITIVNDNRSLHTGIRHPVCHSLR